MRQPPHPQGERIRRYSATATAPLRKRDAHTHTCSSLRAPSQGLSLDALLPAGLAALLPNLRDVRVDQCRLTPAAAASSLGTAAFARLQNVQLENLTALVPHGPDGRLRPAPGTPLATAQLEQLGDLPSLKSLALLDATCPTDFLASSPSLGARLAQLHLAASLRQLQPGSLAAAPAWADTLRRVASCTRLDTLNIPCGTCEELELAAPALQRLQQLHLNGEGLPSEHARADAMVALLLGLPHLRGLHWEACLRYPLRKAYSEPRQQALCRWEVLRFGQVEPRQLARLPLASLTQPVAWTGLLITRQTAAQDVRGAAVNVARNCPAGHIWSVNYRTGPAMLTFGNDRADTGDLLLGLQPLLATVGQQGVVVVNQTWNNVAA